MSEIVLDVKPVVALVDEVLHIRVSGLQPLQPITIVSRVQEEARYLAHAHYICNSQGEVDVPSVSSYGGDYLGVDAMGLIWGMHCESGQAPGLRLMKKDVMTPLVTVFSVMDGHGDPESLMDENHEIPDKHILATRTVARHYAGEGVQRHEVSHGRLIGTFFLPKGDGPFPGVLDLFGTIGGTVEHRSALLASRGFAALSLCYFSPGRGDGLVTDFEYYEEATDWLLSQAKVFKGGIGAIGVSGGSMMVLYLASLCPDKVLACVEINGLHHNTLVDHTYKKEVFPLHPVLAENILYTDEGMVFSPVYIDVGVEEETLIPLHRAKCPILLVHSLGDMAVPPRLMVREMSKQLQRRRDPNYRVLLYPGAGHLLEPPYSPLFHHTYHPQFRSLVVWGGSPHLHALAQEDSWRHILAFFRDNIRDPKTLTDTKLSKL